MFLDLVLLSSRLVFLPVNWRLVELFDIGQNRKSKPMNRTKIILYCVGMVLIIIGFSVMIYGEIRLNTAYEGCFKIPCGIPDESWIVYSGLGLMIAGGICIVIGKRIGN